VILTTHYLEEAESLCRRIAIIDRGRIVEDADKKSLLSKLQMETFVLDLAVEAPKNLMLSGCDYRLTDEMTLEVDVSKDRTLNEVFALLSKQNISVVSMRNKANRLEELFVKMVEPNNDLRET